MSLSCLAVTVQYQINSASCLHGLTAYEGEGQVWVIWAVVCLLAAPRIQLFPE